MANTDQLSVVTQKVVDLLETNKVALDLAIVHFGDQEFIIQTPTACVEPKTVVAEIMATGFQVVNEFEVYIIVYHSKVQNSDVTSKEVIEFGEGIKDLLHLSANKTLSGNVIYGMVSEVEAGYAVRNKILHRAVRMTYKAVSKTRLFT